jgi:hydrogenase/urease accessory protein HupE
MEAGHERVGGVDAGQLVGKGILMGVVHVLSGPDHLSALATLSVGSSLRAFFTGVRWG